MPVKEDAAIHELLRTIETELCALRSFAEVNREAARKIMKKCAKKTSFPSNKELAHLVASSTIARAEVTLVRLQDQTSAFRKQARPRDSGQPRSRRRRPHLRRPRRPPAAPTLRPRCP